MEARGLRTGQAVALLAPILLALSCSATAETSAVPEFPAEKGPAEFPGVSYPAFQGPLPAPGSLHGPVWLIGIDGATWTVARPMIERGELPNLAALVREGAHGVLLSEEPTISPALWATIATGMPRFEHGVVDFQVKAPGSPEAVEVGPPDRRSPALWELVGAAGGTSAVVGWFGSFPAEPIAGHYVSKGFDPADLRPEQVHPDPFVSVLERSARVRLAPEDLDAIGRKALLRDTLLKDARTLSALRVVLEESSPDLVALHLAGIDVAQHLAWRHMDPSSQRFPEDGPPDPGLADVIPASYRFVDRALGELRALAPANTTFVLVSDHGGGPMEVAEAYHLRLPALLEAVGLAQGSAGQVLALDELYRHDKRIWLNLVEIEREGTVPPEQAGTRARQVAQRLAAMRTDRGDPLFASVRVHAGEPDWKPGDPALTVRFSGASLLARSVTDGDRRVDFTPVRVRHNDVSGAHRPEGLLVLAGPGIRPGALPSAANLYQVAPTVLHLLGLPQDGRVLRRAPRGGGVLETALRTRHPVRAVASYPGTERTHLLRGDPARRPIPQDPTREESLERLRSLGYVGGS